MARTLRIPPKTSPIMSDVKGRPHYSVGRFSGEIFVHDKTVAMKDLPPSRPYHLLISLKLYCRLSGEL